MMSEFVQSLKRLYAANKITESVIDKLCRQTAITEEEKNYILRKDG